MRASLLLANRGLAARGNGRLSRLLSVTPSTARSPTPTQSTTTTARRSHNTYSSPGQYMPHSHKHGSEHDIQSRDEMLDALWKDRDFTRRGFTVGIGGPVGSGKTALVQQLCLSLTTAAAAAKNNTATATLELAVVTNDIFTQEDAEYLVRVNALPADRIVAVETGGCPHAAIREDVSANLSALEGLTKMIRTRNTNNNADTTTDTSLLCLCESGGDNLAANFSRELADLTLYVIDVAGGDKVPRKGGPGITQSDLLIINKVDLAEAVGADLDVMKRDADRMRGHGKGPTVFSAVKHGTGMEEIRNFILRHYQRAMELSSKE